jgi:hypothetical protein
MSPAFDIELIWRTHMSLPLVYKQDTEARFGKMLSHDDSIDDRTPGAQVSQLYSRTSDIFHLHGQQLFQPGGMFRGVPTRPYLSPCLPSQPGVCVALHVRQPLMLTCGSSWCVTSW